MRNLWRLQRDTRKSIIYELRSTHKSAAQSKIKSFCKLQITRGDRYKNVRNKKSKRCTIAGKYEAANWFSFNWSTEAFWKCLNFFFIIFLWFKVQLIHLKLWKSQLKCNRKCPKCSFNQSHYIWLLLTKTNKYKLNYNYCPFLCPHINPACFH